MTPEERQELEDAEGVCRRFLACDLGPESRDRSQAVREILADVLGRTADT